MVNTNVKLAGRVDLIRLLSGAIYAALSFYATMFPYQQFLLFFVVPVPAWAAVGGIFAYDLYSSIRSPVSHHANSANRVIVEGVPTCAVCHDGLCRACRRYPCGCAICSCFQG